jgi:hypothetical protein
MYSPANEKCVTSFAHTIPGIFAGIVKNIKQRRYTHGLRLGRHQDTPNAKTEIWTFPVSFHDIGIGTNGVSAAFALNLFGTSAPRLSFQKPSKLRIRDPIGDTATGTKASLGSFLKELTRNQGGRHGRLDGEGYQRSNR